MIYIICPGNCGTGGPDALHQLHFYLKKIGILSEIIYVAGKKIVYSEYKIYNPKIGNFKDIVDSNDNFIIAPETYTNYLKPFFKIKKVIWWLSFDNYHYNIKTFLELKLRGLKYCTSIREFFAVFCKKYSLHNKISNYCGSEYARIQLMKKGTFAKMLVEPLSLKFLNSYANIDVAKPKRNNIVLYNPKKGYEITKLIIKENEDRIRFLPLINYSFDDLVRILSTAKVYIDFGNFPGPERLPKEACLFGCEVLVRYNGASENDVDVPIPNKYKIKKLNYREIGDNILDLLNNYEARYYDFEAYRSRILGLEKKFVDDLTLYFK